MNMEAHPAQPDNLPTQRAIDLLQSSVQTLQTVRDDLQGTHPSRKAREEIRRQLAGVVADCEVVRWALKD